MATGLINFSAIRLDTLTGCQVRRSRRVHHHPARRASRRPHRAARMPRTRSQTVALFVLSIIVVLGDDDILDAVFESPLDLEQPHCRLLLHCEAHFFSEEPLQKMLLVIKFLLLTIEGISSSKPFSEQQDIEVSLQPLYPPNTPSSSPNTFPRLICESFTKCCCFKISCLWTTGSLSSRRRVRGSDRVCESTLGILRSFNKSLNSAKSATAYS